MDKSAQKPDDPAASGRVTVPCPSCGTEAELVESATYTDDTNLTIDKIVFDGEARWVEFDDELVYRVFWCPHCECELRQVEWDGEREAPMLDPTCEAA